MTNTLDTIERTPRGHFVLHLYAAVFRLLHGVHNLSRAEDGAFEATLERFPFLAAYLEEMRDVLPAEPTWEDAAVFWRESILDWEGRCSEPLPLAELGDGRMGFARRLAFVMAGLVEEDSRFGSLFAELQAPLPYRRPTLELLGRIALDPEDEGGTDPWDLLRPLATAGFLRSEDPRAPRAEWRLAVPSVLWDAVRGEVVAAPSPGWSYRPPSAFSRLADLPVPEDLGRQLAGVPDLLISGRIRTLVLRAPFGADPARIQGSVARALGRGLVEADGSGDLDGLGPFAALTRSLPVLRYDLAPGEIATPALVGHGGPVGILAGLEGGLDGALVERSLILTLDAPRAGLRRRLWREALGEAAGDELDAVAERFFLGAGFIRRTAPAAVAHAELGGRAEVAVGDVRQASRELARQQLETLAVRLESAGGWRRLVTGSATRAKLDELELRCRHRERLGDHLGPAFQGNMNRGVRTLFTGPSGTGKTLAAKILAAELGLDIYRVDLAAVINKYIGETEKNLHQVLSRAEALDVVLLLDEGDALLGNRTEVRSSNDRYSNLETNYLLQRLETFEGIVVVTTNLAGQIDDAFKRRMDVVVPFAPPEAMQRFQILELHLPESHTVERPFLEQVAVRCSLSGGQLRNAVVHAALLALDDRANPMQAEHLEKALRSEYRKAGSPFPLAGGKAKPNHGNGFRAAMRATA